MKHYDCEQYSEDWKRLRLGIPTASNFHLLMTPGGKPTSPDNKERRQYLYRLVAERILQTSIPDRFAGNQFTEHGHEREDAAAELFQKTVKGRSLMPGGFMTTDDGRIGCSLDRIIGEYEAVEIKAPAPWTHIGYMVDGPGDRYRPQVQGQLLISGFKWCHFWSYHPSFAPVHIVTAPNERYSAVLRIQLDLFLDELDGVERWVRRQGNVEELVREVNNGT
jgi:hypothetical protein